MEQPACSDRELLKRYASQRSEAAFALLVERHIKLVYATCYRELNRRELAEEAAQCVFLTLARKAQTISSDADLVSWLYTTARLNASVLRRQEGRHMARVQRAAEEAMRRYDLPEDEAWMGIEPVLNDAIASLSTPDRQAILLRFFGEKSLREVGQAMGTNEDVARKRASRALEKLRASLVSRKAAAISAVAFAALLTKHATFAVPANLSASVAKSVGALSSLSTSGAGGLQGGSSLFAKGIIIMSSTKLIAAGVAAVILLLGIGFYAYHHAHALPPNVAWQAPPASQGAQPSQFQWDAPAAADSASQQAQQQIKTQLTVFADGLSSRNVNKVMSIFSPDIQMHGANTDTKHGDLNYSDIQKGAADFLAMGPITVNMRVISCTVTGNTAKVRFGNRGQIAKLTGKPGGMGMGSLNFEKTNGQWLATGF